MKNTLYLLLTALLLLACSENYDKTFKYAGGSFCMALKNYPSTFDASQTTDIYSATVLNQVMEGLVGIDVKTLRVIPQLAASYYMSNDGLTYYFNIRDDVYFHTNAANKKVRLKPTDCIFSIHRACSPNANSNQNAAYHSIYEGNLSGAKAFHEGKSRTISGLSLKGNTLSLKLIKKDDNFLYKLANVSAAVYSESIEKSKSNLIPIGTGPFQFDENSLKSSNKISLIKNKRYYLKDKSGNSLPYLDSLHFIIENRKTEQLALFKENKIQLITDLPTQMITEILEERIEDFNGKNPLLVINNNPLLSTNYYFFNMSDPRFSDYRVRQAFNFAVDKKKLGQNVLHNQYYDMGYYGIVPPISKIFKGYAFNKVKEVSYEYNPELAKKLLAAAGYPNGKGFGNVYLRYNIDDIHQSVADEFAQQIGRVLNINVNIDGSTFDQMSEDAAKANGDIFRSAWTGDYPSPETFLANFYGKSIPKNKWTQSIINPSRYNNPDFDYYFEKGKNTHNKTKSLLNFMKAERILLENPPIIPLWYNNDIQIIYSKVRNLRSNSLNLYCFTEVYLK